MKKKETKSITINPEHAMKDGVYFIKNSNIHEGVIVGLKASFGSQWGLQIHNHRPDEPFIINYYYDICTNHYSEHWEADIPEEDVFKTKAQVKARLQKELEEQIKNLK